MIVRRLLGWADDRTGLAHFSRAAVNKVFPNHCSTHVKDGLKKSPIRPGDSASTYL